MARSEAFQSSFASGVLSDEAYGRVDIEQYAQGLKTGTNVILRPQGGVARRPGSKYVHDAGADGRLIPFLFSRADTAMFAFTSGNLAVIVDDAKVTELPFTGTLAQIENYDTTQSEDTLIVFHPDLHTRRIFRVGLGDDPIRTSTGETWAVVYAPAHSIQEVGGVIGLAGVEATTDYTADELNQGFQVELLDQGLNSDPFTTAASTKIVTVATPIDHELSVGDRVQFENATDLRTASEAVVESTDLNDKPFIVKTVPTSTTFTIELATRAESTVTDGGSDCIMRVLDTFKIVGLPSAATVDESAGGDSGTGWLAADIDFENIPFFDFNDEHSPNRVDEIQRLEFVGTWVDNFDFRLRLGSRDLATLKYDSDTDNMASAIQRELRRLSNTSADGITVRYESSSSQFVITFGGGDGGQDWPQMTLRSNDNENGTISFSTEVDGGSSVEPVWSDTYADGSGTGRGWPRTGAFHHDSLWMAGSRAKPVGLWRSKVRDYFNFDTGSGKESEAIARDLQGQDPILKLVSHDGLKALTEGSELTVRPTGEAITDANISAERTSRYGSANLPIALVDGAIVFVDRTERALRRLAFSFEQDSDRAVDISILSPDFILTPVDLASVRDDRGEYVYVVRSDGKISVLNINTDQGAIGFTEWETEGLYLSVAALDNRMYALVRRTIDGSTEYYVEKFDPDHKLDCGVRAYQSTVVASPQHDGLDHLDGEEVQVLADLRRQSDQTVSQGVVSLDDLAGGADVLVLAEAGLGFTWSLSPLPPRVARKARLNLVELDILTAREFDVDGYRVTDAKGAELFDNPPPEITGFRRMNGGKGWTERPTFTASSDSPWEWECRGARMGVDF